MGKRAAMKDFFQTLCADSELASTLTKDLKETVYLDKRVLNHHCNKFVDCCIGSGNPFKHDKYRLFTWKVYGRIGFNTERLNEKGEWIPDPPPKQWTHANRVGCTDNFAMCTNELLYCNYDVFGNMGTKEYLYMR